MIRESLLDVKNSDHEGLGLPSFRGEDNRLGVPILNCINAILQFGLLFIPFQTDLDLEDLSLKSVLESST